MKTSYNGPLKSNGIKRIILILLVTVLIVGFVPTVNGDCAYADSYNYDNAYYMLSLVNQQRAAYGLSALEMDGGMLDAAMTRAYECSYYFSHYRPNGGDASSLNWKIYSENISWGMSADRTMSGWMDSYAHRDNILDSGYKSVGIGCYVTSGGTPYWAMVFSYEYADGSSGSSSSSSSGSSSSSVSSSSSGSSSSGGAADNSGATQSTGGAAAPVEEPEVKNGWEHDGNGWGFYENDEKLTSQWVQDGDYWNYLKDDGYMAADEWVEDSDGLRWVDSEGKIVKGQWIEYDGNKYYLKSDGYMAAEEWLKSSKGLMWVDSEGLIVKGKWLKYGDTWYYLKSDGYVAGDTRKLIEQYKLYDQSKVTGSWILRYVA